MPREWLLGQGFHVSQVRRREVPKSRHHVSSLHVAAEECEQAQGRCARATNRLRHLDPNGVIRNEYTTPTHLRHEKPHVDVATIVAAVTQLVVWVVRAPYPKYMTAFDWRTATPAEVDFQYSPSQHSLRPLADYLVEYHELSARHDARTLRVVGQPLLIYIHGGYWQRLSAADSLFNADDALRHGISLHAVEYTLAPHASIPEIINECLADVAATLEELKPSRVVLAGCSAGAHLSAMCARDAVIAPQLNAVVLLSGIYDLRPLIVTPTNDPLHLDENSAIAVSPQLLNPSALLSNALLAVGRHESDEFIRQNAEYAQHVAQVGTHTECIVVDHRDHFNLPYDLLKEGTEVGDWTLRILKGDQS